jgi:acetylornithine deacetylase
MKPTSWSSPAGASNIIPVEATMQGDIRLTPFYSLSDAKGAIERYVREFNEKIHTVSEYSPAFKNALPDGARARVELTWVGDCYHGFAADLKSFGFQAIDQATKDVLGSSKPFSVTGSLPLVSDLQKAGFDVQMIGYGVEEVFYLLISLHSTLILPQSAPGLSCSQRVLHHLWYEERFQDHC